ncbi:hypothetical protein NKH72_24290 [Mesorhizobium sp. M0955]|uniref:hypothetical protein n=1 Tax=Mesorhizobium sp. M0955 TaxID=2957033 RepID=UPI003337E3FB
MTSKPTEEMLDAEALEALARAYDREDASQRGEPDPWEYDDGNEDERLWRAERMACAEVGARAYLATLTKSSPVEAVAPVAWLAAGPGWKRVVIYKEAAEKLCADFGEISPLYLAPALSNPEAPGRVDAIVSSLYRRFKDWSKKGFGPDDVTWCEVKADIISIIASNPEAPAAPVSALPEGTLAMHGSDISIAYATREEAERAFDLLEAALASTPPAPTSAVDGEVVNGIMDELFGPFDPHHNYHTWVSPNRAEVRARLESALNNAISNAQAVPAPMGGAGDLVDLAQFIETVGNGSFYEDYDASLELLGKARKAFAALAGNSLPSGGEKSS